MSHDKGNTFRVIMSVLTEELGYHVHWKIIDGKAWTPQHRERIYIVGFRDDVQFNWELVLRAVEFLLCPVQKTYCSSFRSMVRRCLRL